MKLTSIIVAACALAVYQLLKRYIGAEKETPRVPSTECDSVSDKLALSARLPVTMPEGGLTYAPLKAIFFAIGNFNRLSADDRCHLTAESLRKAYWYGGFNLEERKAVVYLLENLERFGKVLSKTRETAYVGGSGWAMPVSFDKTVYGYSTDELLKAMRELADEAKLDPAAYLKQG